MIYSTYIEINCHESSIPLIDSILDVKANKHLNGNWIYFVSSNEISEVYKYYDSFYLILKDKIELLEKNLGIEKNLITIWLVIEYVEKCDFKFNHPYLLNFGSLGLQFSISCYKSDLTFSVFS